MEELSDDHRWLTTTESEEKLLGRSQDLLHLLSPDPFIEIAQLLCL